jgi:hypothetical protein
MRLHLVYLATYTPHHIKYAVTPVNEMIVNGNHHQVRISGNALPLAGKHGQIIFTPGPV